MNIYKYLFGLLISLLGIGCLSYPETVSNVPVSDQTMTSLEGVYEFEPYLVDYNSEEEFAPVRSFDALLNRTILRGPSESWIPVGRSFEIKFSENRINFIWDNEAGGKQEVSLKMELDEDDYLRIKNKNFKVIMIPYLLGGVDVTKVRMTINERGDLVCDVINHRSGAVLFVAFANSNTWKFRLVFKRKE